MAQDGTALEDALAGAAVVVDALLGTGFRVSPVVGRQAIEA